MFDTDAPVPAPHRLITQVDGVMTIIRLPRDIDAATALASELGEDVREAAYDCSQPHAYAFYAGKKRVWAVESGGRVDERRRHGGRA